MSFSQRPAVTIDELVDDLFTNPEDHPEDFENGVYTGPNPEAYARVAHLYANTEHENTPSRSTGEKTITVFTDLDAFKQFTDRMYNERGLRATSELYEVNYDGKKAIVWKISPSEEAMYILPPDTSDEIIEPPVVEHSLPSDESDWAAPDEWDYAENNSSDAPEPEEEESFLELPVEAPPAEEPLRPYTVGFDDDPSEKLTANTPVFEEDDSSEEITANTPVFEEDESDYSDDSDVPYTVVRLHSKPSSTETRYIETIERRRIPESYIRDTLRNLPRGLSVNEYPLDTDLGLIVHAIHFIRLRTTGFYDLSLDDRVLVVEIYLDEMRYLIDDQQFGFRCTAYTSDTVAHRFSDADQEAFDSRTRKKIPLATFNNTRHLIERTFESIFLNPIREIVGYPRFPSDKYLRSTPRNVAHQLRIQDHFVEHFNEHGYFDEDTSLQVMCPRTLELLYLYKLQPSLSAVLFDAFLIHYDIMQNHLSYLHRLHIERCMGNFIHKYGIKYVVRNNNL